MNDHDDIKKELEELSPFLLNRKGNDAGFQTPPMYFEKFAASITEKATATAVGPHGQNFFYPWLYRFGSWLHRPTHAMAFSLGVALLVVGVFWFAPYHSYLSPNDQAALTDEEILEYIAGNYEDFDLDLLIKASEHLETPVNILPGSVLEDPDMDKLLPDLLDDIHLEDLNELL